MNNDSTQFVIADRDLEGEMPISYWNRVDGSWGTLERASTYSRAVRDAGLPEPVRSGVFVSVSTAAMREVRLATSKAQRLSESLTAVQDQRRVARDEVDALKRKIRHLVGTPEAYFEAVQAMMLREFDVEVTLDIDNDAGVVTIEVGEDITIDEDGEWSPLSIDHDCYVKVTAMVKMPGKGTDESEAIQEALERTCLDVGSEYSVDGFTVTVVDIEQHDSHAEPKR